MFCYLHAYQLPFNWYPCFVGCVLQGTSNAFGLLLLIKTK